jgi:ATP-dependent exoDNAse (exonuclease V) alpha subunit
VAIFHLSAKVVSRGAGQSAIAKAAYNSRSKLEDERTGQTKDYSRYGGVEFSGIFAPKDAPAWASDRQQLWNEVERREDASNRAASAQLAREVVIALPHELTDQQREWLVKDFVREQFTRKGMVADVNIHAPGGEGDQRNHHAHILVTMRSIGPEGFGPKVRAWNSDAQLEQWREQWELMTNKQLERHGHEARIDRRTLEAQGIEREPTTHRGPHVDAIERRHNIEAENTTQNTDRADELAELRASLSNITRDIAAERNELAAGKTSVSPHQPEPANNNQPEANFSADLESTVESARDVSGNVSSAIGGAANALAETAVKLVTAFLGADRPTPPPTKEVAEAMRSAAAAERRAHIERMLTDKTYKAQQEKIAREELEREARQRDDDYQRTRQR